MCFCVRLAHTLGSMLAAAVDMQQVRLAGRLSAGIPGQPLSAKGLMRALAQHISKPLPVVVSRADGSRATLHITASDAALALEPARP